MARNLCTSILIVVIIATTIVSGQDKLGRGESCENDSSTTSSKVNVYKWSPKFKGSSHRDDKLKTCDDDKGLFCVESENPAFKKDGQSSTRKVCDCSEDFYFDPVSGECRIQIGFACNPDQGQDQKRQRESLKWNEKCPEDAHCSTDLGRYGPRGAKGMCRCKEGFIVSSIWFVNGGGSVCEKVEEVESRQMMLMKGRSGLTQNRDQDYELQYETNSLTHK